MKTTTKHKLVVAALVELLAVCLTSAQTPVPQRRDLTAIKAEQAALTPGQVLADLQHGNERFASGKTKSRDMRTISRSLPPASIRTPLF